MSAYITSLTLGNFRNHQQLELDTDAPAVVITGKNGAGKTNILEALSLFSVGRGFRHATMQEQLYQHTAPYWRVEAQLQHSTLLTAYDASVAAKRILKLDAQPITRQAELLEHLLVLWFLPTQSHLFSAGMSERRKYLDRIVYSVDATHATRINAYEHYMRERKKIIEQPRYDEQWLEVIEEKIAHYAAEIIHMRHHTIAQLMEARSHIAPFFPDFSLDITGEAETLWHAVTEKAEAVQQLRVKLREYRFKDARAGRTSIGAHKSQFHVYFEGKRNRPAESCSTGEQKALLLSLLIAQIAIVRPHMQQHPRPIILLLDEMLAHLDEQRRESLCALLQDSPIQLFATGTDEVAFPALQNVKHITL